MWRQQAENCFGTWLYTYALQAPGLGAAAAANAVSEVRPPLPHQLHVFAAH
jgi:hypothetical protein